MFCFSFFKKNWGLWLFCYNLLRYVVILIIMKPFEYHLCKKTLNKKEEAEICDGNIAENTVSHPEQQKVFFQPRKLSHSVFSCQCHTCMHTIMATSTDEKNKNTIMATSTDEKNKNAIMATSTDEKNKNTIMATSTDEKNKNTIMATSTDEKNKNTIIATSTDEKNKNTIMATSTDEKNKNTIMATSTDEKNKNGADP